jgi:hypothetical protein
MKGISRVIVEVANLAPLKLPPQVLEDLTTFDTQGLGSEWVEYHFKHVDKDADYDYSVLVKLLTIGVSPDETKDVDVVFTKQVEDGEERIRDNDGNVIKDSTGNDMWRTKYKEITCTLIETQQLKSVEIKGEVEIYSIHPERMIQKTPFGAANTFEHHSARAAGNKEALTAEALEKTKREKVPFPTDVEMVMTCTETIKPAIRDAIYANRQYIK